MADTVSSIVQEKQGTTLDIFNNVESAVQQVFPGSDSHVRYQDASSVGLAVMIGRPNVGSYNPLDPQHSTPAFLGSNEEVHPEAWQPIPKDSEFLEDNTPGMPKFKTTDVPRFEFFALAKAENINRSGARQSYDPQKLVIKPGQVGLAGGITCFETVFSTSGLWEVHDLLVSLVLMEEVMCVLVAERTPKTAEKIAKRIQDGVEIINSRHKAVRAEDIAHKDIAPLLSFPQFSYR